MKKNELAQSIKIIVLGLILAFGVSYVSAWTNPTGAPGVSNALPPLYSDSSGTQTKAGGLAIGSDPSLLSLIVAGVAQEGIATSALELSSSTGTIIFPSLISGGANVPLCFDSNNTLVKCQAGTCASPDSTNPSGYFYGNETGTSLCASGDTASAMIGGTGNTPFHWTCTRNNFVTNCTGQAYGNCGSANTRYYTNGANDWQNAPGSYSYCSSGLVHGIQSINNNTSWGFASWKCGVNQACCSLHTNAPNQPNQPLC